MKWWRSWLGRVDPEPPEVSEASVIAAAPAVLIAPRPATETAERQLFASRGEERAREIAVDLRMEGLNYRAIADRLGNFYRPGLIKKWCEDEIVESNVSTAPNSTVKGFFGQKGSGKSLSVAGDAWEYYQEGIPVYYNPRGMLKFPPMPGRICEFASLHDMLVRAPYLRDCLLVMDEVQVNLSKYRASTKVSLLMRGIAQQIRKLGMDLDVTSNAPDQIDQGLKEQLDFHAMCRAHLPPEDPRNFISLRWYDTQEHYGKRQVRMNNRRQMEARLRFGQRLFPATDIYQIYDHTVQVNPLEVIGIDSDVIAEMQTESELGISLAEVEVFLRNELVPYYVNTLSATTIVPAAASGVIKQVWMRYDHAQCCQGVSTERLSEAGCTDGQARPFEITAQVLERAMVNIGMERRGRSKGYILPETPEDLELFAFGGWSASA